MSSTDPVSTARPAYITCTRSAMPATTPRSWVIMITAAPVSCCAVRSTSSTWAWMVTSRAVVGSSAMITSGSLAIAMAIITRWRMPPENSWGNDLRRIFGLGMPTRSSSSTARARAAEPDMLLWTSNASVIWSPTVKIGVSDDSGSWNTIASSLPRSFDRSSSPLPMSSSPCSLIDPVSVAVSGSRPMIASDVTDLPEPDSPTMPSTSPAARSKLTPRTARTAPASEGKLTVRSWTLRTVLPAVVRRTFDAATMLTPPLPVERTSDLAPSRCWIRSAPVVRERSVGGSGGR